MNLTGLALVYLPRKLWNTFLHWWYSLRSFVAVFNVLSAEEEITMFRECASVLYTSCFVKMDMFISMYLLHVYLTCKKWTLCPLLHRDSGISAIAFHPTRHVAVSSSYGGDFKVILVEWRYKSWGSSFLLNFSIWFFRYGFAMMGFSRKVRCFRVLVGHALLLGHTSMIHFTL